MAADTSLSSSTPHAVHTVTTNAAVFSGVTPYKAKLGTVIVDVSVTAVIPTFERPVSTLQAVESALNQTRRPEAIVVIDDGSSENTRRTLREAFAQLPVTFLTEPHCGHPGRVRSAGLKNVSTTHVAFLDSDDVWARSKIEIQVDAARQGVRAQGSAYQVDTNQLDALGGCTEITFVRLSLRDLLKQNQLCNSSVFIEVSLLREIGGLATSYAVRGIEDYATWLRVATRSAWSFSPTPLVAYSDFPATSMRATNEFSVSERTLALWDLAWWLTSQGKTVPNVAKLGMRGADFVLRNWAARQGPDV